jgi:methionine-gamma-lyase
MDITKVIHSAYDTSLSEQSIINPIFKTSTFLFPDCKTGEKSFQNCGTKDNQTNLIYSRINNPNMEIVEDKLKLLDDTESSLLFTSGLSAITTTLLSLLKSGDEILFNSPVYGGTYHFLKYLLPEYKITSKEFQSYKIFDPIHLDDSLLNERTKVIFIETPCNPLLHLTSINILKHQLTLAEQKFNSKITLIVDNTMCGPLFLKPIKLGADLVIYSITKFIGGHSDLIAGCINGSIENINKIKKTRNILGTICDSDTCWLIQRSLSTLKIRMEAQKFNCRKIFEYLLGKQKQNIVYQIFYPGFIDINSPLDECEQLHQLEIFNNEYLGQGSIISFTLNKSKDETLKFLDNLQIIKLAVSLGSVETLIQHPSTMTHSNFSIEEKKKMFINDNLVRLSLGLENYLDLIDDMEKAFSLIN